MLVVEKNHVRATIRVRDAFIVNAKSCLGHSINQERVLLYFNGLRGQIDDTTGCKMKYMGLHIVYWKENMQVVVIARII